jgi:hypothetical protein
VLEVKVRDEIRESHAEDCKKTEDSQPHEHEGAIILPRRRCRDSEDEVQSAKKVCQMLDHKAARWFAEGFGTITDSSARCSRLAYSVFANCRTSVS